MGLTKIDDRGLKTPIDLLDNEKIRLGTGNDLQIYHSGAHSFIEDSGTGNLSILTNSLHINNPANAEAMARFNENGAVELYYQNSKKFETTNAGNQIFGNLVCGSVTLSGGGVSIQDSDKFICGNGDDLQIYHDGSNSYIKNSTGMMRIQGTQFQVKDEDGNESLANFIPQGAVELYHDNSKKFETTSSGITVTGGANFSSNVVVDSGTVRCNSGFSSDVDLILNADANANGTGSIVFKESNSEKIRIDSSGHLLFAGTSEEITLQTSDGSDDGYLNLSGGGACSQNRGAQLVLCGNERSGLLGTCQLMAGNAGSASSVIQLFTGGSERMRIHSNGRISAGTTSADARLHLKSPDGGNDAIILEQNQDAANYQNQISFKNAGTQTAFIKGGKDSSNNNFGIIFGTGTSERMRIASDGNVGIGKSSSSLDVDGSIFIGSGQGMNMVKSGSGGKIITLNRRTNVGTSIEFYRGSSVGSISHNNSSTSYNTSSDYRLKENVVALSDGITRLKTLKPSRFNFIADKDVTVDGFIAHEVTAVPEAIQGEKDAVVTQAMVDNNEYEEERLGEIIPQGIDQAKLVPLLTAALQEAISKIEVLETKVAALKAA